ncbi:hypothetical protein DLAC_05199 [Tieghemostelium lacteum]|uniref:Uncharacterized protein n=1 Tax=Tieghemostelium lacteum TaxID=361077 RepID=A0A151ZIX9_TIELA|nr:hypothetical protein DLAC_05199 [Tieghemostelium lacteum]|eukprot:KYQ93804.1 hypothetical protein DLAC_05199 [Tieghemostelium lacteum]
MINKLHIIIYIFICLLYINISEQQIITAFSYDQNENTMIKIDLNQQTIQNYTTKVASEIIIYNVIETTSSPDQINLFVLNTTSTYYSTASYFYSNLSLSPNHPFDQENLDFFAWNVPYSLYDPLSNKITISGISPNITFVIYDLINNQVEDLVTSFVPADGGLPVSAIGPQENQVTSFFYDSNEKNAPTITITDLDTNETQNYIIEGFKLNPMYALTNIPLYIKGNLYIVLIEEDTRSVSLNLVVFNSDSTSNNEDSIGSNKVQLKLLHSAPKTFIGGMPCVVTQDQQSVILIGANDLNYESLQFTIYDLETNTFEKVEIDNSKVNMNLQNYIAYLAE